MSQKIQLAIVFGGQSAEHKISLISAKSVAKAVNLEHYDLTVIGIDKSGKWWMYENIEQALLNSLDPKEVQLAEGGEPVALIAGLEGAELISLEGTLRKKIEVVFPLVHGTQGEDGTLQGLLKLANVPFVGPGVLASAVAMDKDVMKRLFKEAGLPVAKSITLQSQASRPSFDAVVEKLGLPFFVKPANLGSSVGVSKVKNKEEFSSKVEFAFQFDRKILIEEFIEGREIECSVLGNESPIASLPGELIPQHDFYSYEAKYLDEQGALFEIPAKVSAEQVEAIQALSVKAYQALCCEGMGRVDIFLQPNGRIVLNEINTIPGFTAISMYPKLWKISGLSYSMLIDKLITLAVDRHQQEKNLNRALTFMSEKPD